MNNKSPEDYMREMMELYKRSANTGSTPEPESVPEPIPEPAPQPVEEPVWEERQNIQPENEYMAEEEEVPAAEETEPEPQTPAEAPPVIQPETAPSERESSYGYIQVTARAASAAQPLQGVSVYISRGDELLYTLLTDSSGSTAKVRLPAPPVAKDGGARVQPYSIYNVTAYLEGYAELKSESVPVFAGVTSVQPFAMLPLPSGVGNETVTNQNTEPEF